MSRPIKIVKVTDGYNVFVNNAPVVPDYDHDNPDGITIDRAKAGLKTRKNTKPPIATKAFLFKKASDASRTAHQIGRYMLNLGDHVYSYVELVGVTENYDDWWSRTSKEE